MSQILTSMEDKTPYDRFHEPTNKWVTVEYFHPQDNVAAMKYVGILLIYSS